MMRRLVFQQESGTAHFSGSVGMGMENMMGRQFHNRVYLAIIGIIGLQSVCFGLSDAYYKFIDSDSDEFMVVAHRGDWRNYPENSLSGIQSCIDHGVDVLEIDVWLTQDGVPILMHDSTVDRTTDGSGSVSSLTLAQIKSLTLEGTANEQVPTLEEAVLLMKNQCMFYLDKQDSSTVIAATMAVLKRTDTVLEGMFRSTGTAQEVIDRFAGAGITDLSTIHIAFKITCYGTTSPSMETIMDELAVFEPNRPGLLQVNYDNAGHPIFDAANVSAIRQGGSRFFVNTMPGRAHEDPYPGAEPADWDWVLGHGINSAQSDRPLWMVPYVNGYAYYESPVNGTPSAGTYPSLSWMRAWNVDCHNVYLGTSMVAVGNATTASPEFKGPQASPYSPGALADGQIYYWRVDEILNDGTSKPGAVWSFTAAAIPPSGSTLYLHLTADDLTLVDGAAVASWTDSEGTAEFTGAATYKADYTNGHAAVLFNGSSDVLRVTNLAGPDTASVTMFVVGNFVSGLASTDYMVSGQNYVTEWGGDASGDNRLRLAVSGTDWRTRIGDGGNLTSAGDIADTDSHVFSVVSGQDATSAVKMLVDGTQVLSGTHGATANCLDVSAVNLGAYYGRITEGPNGVNNANCYIAEVRIYDGAMTDFEIATINQELHDKYFTAHSPVPVDDASISGPISGGTAMEISWTGTLGFTYGVETNSNLIDGSWHSLTNNIPGTGGLTTITNTITDLNQLFYRIISE